MAVGLAPPTLVLARSSPYSPRASGNFRRFLAYQLTMSPRERRLLPRRRRARRRLVLFTASLALTLALIVAWIDSTRTYTSLSYSIGLGTPRQAEPLPGELQGMWHDTVGTLGVLITDGTCSLSFIRAEFTFYDPPTEAALFRGLKLTRTFRAQEFVSLLVQTPTGQLNWFTNDFWFPFLHGFGYSQTNSPTHVRHAFSVPLSLLTLLAALPALWLTLGRHRQRRRLRRQECCSSCDYDRRGLPAADAPCPECGQSEPHPIERQTQSRA